MTPAERREYLELLETREKLLAETRLVRYRPYAKQQEFHAAGKHARERLLIAANQVGKTLSAAAETAMHLTGLYPDWWEGKKFDAPTNGWAASTTAQIGRAHV